MTLRSRMRRWLSKFVADIVAHQSAWILFLLLAAASSITWTLTRASEDRLSSERLQRWAGAIQISLTDRMDSYTQVLKGASSLFNLGHEVTRQQWQAYVESIDLDSTFPGIQGVGFARWIPAADKAKREEAIRTEGFASYGITPAGERPIYVAIEFLEPLRGRNLRAFGYDMYSEPVRRAAMDRASLSGVPTTSQCSASGTAPLTNRLRPHPWPRF